MGNPQTGYSREDLQTNAAVRKIPKELARLSEGVERAAAALERLADEEEELREEEEVKQ